MKLHCYKSSLIGQRGFSLVELMVVLGIIGTLSTLTLPTMKNFVGRAKEAEAALNVRAIVNLAQAYFFDENDRLSAFGASQFLNVLSLNDYSSDTSCHNTTAGNYIGFRPASCRKLNYVYGWATSGSARTVGAFAFEGSTGGVKKIYPQCIGTSFWTGDVGGVRNTISPSVPAKCMTCFNIALAAAVGDTNFDVNGNGNVGGVADVEITSLIPAVNMHPLITGMGHISSCP